MPCDCEPTRPAFAALRRGWPSPCRWIVLVMPALLIGWLSTGAAAARESVGRTSFWLPQNVSSFGAMVDRLFYVVLWMTGVVGAAVFILLIWFLVRYRAKPGRAATFIHGNNRLELAWTIVPALILAVTAAGSQATWTQIKQLPSESAMIAGVTSIAAGPASAAASTPIEVEIVAQQFLWNFHYPGADGRFGPRKRDLIDNRSADPAEQIGLDRSDLDAADDLVTQRMVIPVHRQVRIRLTSKDVIHSFYLPNFRIKQDAVPGLIARVWLQAHQTSGEVIGRTADGRDKPFDIVCAELCGQGHYKMRGQLFVVSDADYQAFLEEEASYLVPAGEDAYY